MKKPKKILSYILAFVISLNPILTTGMTTAYGAETTTETPVATPIMTTTSAVYAGDTTDGTRQVINFNNDWRYYKGNLTDAELTDHDDKEWLYVNLPHSTTHYTPEDKYAYLGISWYRKTFTLNDVENKTLKLTFEGVMQQAEVWLNGEKIITHTGGYIPFVIDLTDKIISGQPNVIAVKTDSRPSADFAPGKNQPDFQYFGGIYRDVYITATDALHISNAVEDITVEDDSFKGIFITAPAVSTASATLKVKTNVYNGATSAANTSIKTSVFAPDGSQVATNTSSAASIVSKGDHTFTQTLKVTNPELWNVYTPDLYTVKTTVLSDGVQHDTVDTDYGIRKVEWKREGLYLNDEKLDIQGANLHSETYMLGNAMPESAIFEEVKRLKEYGFDAIRMSHYPHSPAFYEACDQYGLVVIDCLSGWQEFHNTPLFRESTYRETRSMIRRSRNNASVVAWETSLNESHFPNDWAAEVNRIVDQEWPTDGVSKAYTAGWKAWDNYDIGLGTPQASIFTSNSWEGAEKPENKDKPIIIAEYGDWNYNGFTSSTRVTREPEIAGEPGKYVVKGGDEGMLIQADNMQEAVTVNRAKGEQWLGIDALWDYADYAGFDAGGSSLVGLMTYCGVVDVYRLPKHSAFFYQSQRPANINMDKYGIETGPMVYIANTWAEGSPRDEVRVYSNCDTVELYLGDTLLEKRTVPDTEIWGPHGSIDNNQTGYPGTGENISTASLDSPPFTFTLPAGIDTTLPLKAVGKMAGSDTSVVEDVRTPPEAASQIKLRPENNVPLRLDGSDARLVWIDVLDANGTVVNTASADVSFTVEGPGIVIGEKTVTTKGGQLAVWVRSKRGEGDITLTATSDGLKGTTVTLPTVYVDGLPVVPVGGDADETLYTPPAPPEVANLALNKVATASTSENANLPKNAVDGDLGNKWCESGRSGGCGWVSLTAQCPTHPDEKAEPQWIQIDLGSVYDLDRLYLEFESSTERYSYTVSTSNDPEVWGEDNIIIDERKTPENKNGKDNITYNIPAEKRQSGRYLRITMDKTWSQGSTNTWACMKEIEAYGKRSNIAYEKQTTASGGTPPLAVDGNTTSKWTGDGTEDQWLEVDLDGLYQLSQISVLFDDDTTNQFVIKGSIDGNLYRTIGDFSDATEMNSTVEMSSDALIQYLRIENIITGDGTTPPSIKEIGLLGERFNERSSNIAGDKSATASSSKEGTTPNMGSEAVPGKFWMPANQEDAAWWIVDTEGYSYIDNIELQWNEEIAHQYIIEFSTDGKTWTTVADKSANTTPESKTKILVEGLTRFIRVSLPANRSSDQGFGFFAAYAYPFANKNVTAITNPETNTENPVNTTFDKLVLPTEVAVTLDDTISATLPVTWSNVGYDATLLTEQTLTGTITTLDGVALGEETKVTMAIILGDASQTPVFIKQPISQTSVVGDVVTFIVEASVTDGGTLTYQWQMNDGTAWTDIPDATAASYTTLAVTAEDNGTKFHCVVTNTLDAKRATTTSNEAVLKVGDMVVETPIIAINPQSQTVAIDEMVNFVIEASVTDGGTLTYQWQMNDGTAWTDIPDATTASYTTAPVTKEDDGKQFHCVVTNTLTGATAVATSDVATLTVLDDSTPSTGNIVSIAEFAPVQVTIGTPIGGLRLPASVVATLDSDATIVVPVTWNTDSYLPTTIGTYTFTGTLTLPVDVLNPEAIGVTFTVIVVNQSIPVPEEDNEPISTTDNEIQDKKTLDTIYELSKIDENTKKLPKNVEVYEGTNGNINTVNVNLVNGKSSISFEQMNNFGQMDQDIGLKLSIEGGDLEIVLPFGFGTNERKNRIYYPFDYIKDIEIKNERPFKANGEDSYETHKVGGDMLLPTEAYVKFTTDIKEDTPVFVYYQNRTTGDIKKITTTTIGKKGVIEFTTKQLGHFIITEKEI